MDSLRLPDYYIGSNGLPSILNSKQQLMMKRPTINQQSVRILNNNNSKTICGYNTVKTKQNTRRQDAEEMETLIVRPKSHEIKKLIIIQDRSTDAGLNKKLKCMYNEMKKKHMENKLKDQNVMVKTSSVS